MPDRLLVVAPHADDEVVGCGGLIARAVKEGHKVDVVIGSIGGLLHRHLKELATVEERKQELHRAAEILGVADVTVLFEGYDMRLDTVAQVDIVTKLDAILDRGYDEVYFPYPSHNHDHQEMYRATFAALRHTVGRKSPRLSALYEYAFIGWNPSDIRGGKMYVDISDYLDVKVRAFEAYKSQLRDAPHPCSCHGIRVLAQMRGLESCCHAAELFYVQKIIR